jgi:hypothetical protein
MDQFIGQRLFEPGDTIEDTSGFEGEGKTKPRPGSVFEVGVTMWEFLDSPFLTMCFFK